MALTAIPVITACDPCHKIEKLCRFPTTFKIETLKGLPLSNFQFAGVCMPIAITPYFQGTIEVCCPSSQDCITVEVDTPIRCIPYEICDLQIDATCFFEKISATSLPVLSSTSATTVDKCSDDYFYHTEICFDPFSSQTICETFQDLCNPPRLETHKITQPVQNVILTVTGVVSGVKLSGVSAPFTIYPRDVEVFLKGECFNMAEEIINRMPCEHHFCDGISPGPLALNPLFQRYLQAVLGGPLSQRIHHGISEFFTNQKDIDRCNIDSLIDIAHQLDIDVIDYNLQDAPAAIKRLLHIFSINESLLFGQQRSFDLDTTEILGKPDNIGDPIRDGELITDGDRIWAIDFVNKDYHLIYVKSLSGATQYPIEDLEDPLLDRLDELCFYRHVPNAEERVCNMIDYDKTHFKFESENFEEMACILFAQELLCGVLG